jgi:spore maturation protein CgeB
MVSLNVNTVEGSGTMFSRRLIEILACGSLAVTTPGISVDRYFRDYCHVVTCEAEARDLMSGLKNGLTPRDRDMIATGAEYVLKQHSWAHRLEEVMRVISHRKTDTASRLALGEVRSLSA